ncbi:hypothetical protein DFQ27_002465 [Actinomortierella ambigua]|uniref:F-box domain-containing protein n=1 Tax=Actinomortierella ambigua TaxID=1343610 RepID=A0A9P6U6X0_9FUNG|nr:hypothetical protein DFQ27_002465 [Actinomortierella ambigua]
MAKRSSSSPEASTSRSQVLRQESMMDVPDLRLHAGKFFDISGLRACALVCRAWHRDFQPLVWRKFSAKLSETNSSGQIDSIRHNIHWIRSLKWTEYRHTRCTTSTLFKLLSTECYDSLVSLDLRICAHLGWHQYQDLFQNNKQTLQQVSFAFEHGAGPVPNDRQFVGALRDLSSLRRLTFFFVAPSFINLIHLMKTMPCMDTLEFIFCEMATIRNYADVYIPEFWLSSSSSSTGPPVLSLKRFELQGPWEDDPVLVMLLKLCPKLEHLMLKTSNNCKGPCQLVQDGCFPHLRSLGLHAGGLPPSLLSSALKSLPPHQLTTVHLSSSLATTVQDLVEHHHQSLEKVEIGVTDDQESCIIEFLSRCSQLQHFRFTAENGSGVEVRYAIARPWVCTKLKELAVEFVMGPGYYESAAAAAEALSSASGETAPPLGFLGRTEDVQAMTVLMTRLGQLSQIKELELLPVEMLSEELPPFRKVPLPWSLANGFSHLSCWTRLEQLDFGQYQPFPFGIPELQFMRQHWTALKEISSDDIDSEEIVEWLGEHWPELAVAT